MLVHLNGWPGVGKLTIARQLHRKIGGHLLDNHSVYNVAFALTAFRTPEFYETVRATRDVAFARIAAFASETPVIMTNALSTSNWGQENWQAILDLAKQRGTPLYAVTLSCAPSEHLQRMVTPERAYLGKLTDPGAWHPSSNKLLEEGADFVLRLDTTGLSAEASAERIETWLEQSSGGIYSD